jgi:hypothetical protein
MSGQHDRVMVDARHQDVGQLRDEAAPGRHRRVRVPWLFLIEKPQRRPHQYHGAGHLAGRAQDLRPGQVHCILQDRLHGDGGGKLRRRPAQVVDVRPFDVVRAARGRACGAPLTLETSPDPAGLTARARSEARPEMSAANLTGFTSTYQEGGIPQQGLYVTQI